LSEQEQDNKSPLTEVWLYKVVYSDKGVRYVLKCGRLLEDPITYFEAAALGHTLAQVAKPGYAINFKPPYDFEIQTSTKPRKCLPLDDKEIDEVTRILFG